MENSGGRVCTACGEYKDSTSFYLNRHKKLRAECKDCAHRKGVERVGYRKKNKDPTIYASEMATRAIQRCRPENSSQYYRRYGIQNRFESHEELTKYILENFEGNIASLIKEGKTPSLDRIDPSGHYEEGNIRVIDTKLNAALGRKTLAKIISKPLKGICPDGEETIYENVLSASNATGMARKTIRRSFTNNVKTRSGYLFQLIDKEAE